MKESEFYDEATETMPVDGREHYINEKLHEIVQYAYDNAPAVRRKMEQSGIMPSDISTAKDLPKIPVTLKDDFSEMQKLEPPFGGFLAVPETKETFISPGPIYEPEIPDNQYHAAAKALYAAGFRRGDRAMVTVSFHMVPAGQHFAGAMEKLGITTIPTGVGNTELQIQIMRDLKVTGYAGTPSFLITLIKKAEEMGYDFTKDFSGQRCYPNHLGRSSSRSTGFGLSRSIPQLNFYFWVMSVGRRQAGISLRRYSLRLLTSRLERRCHRVK